MSAPEASGYHRKKQPEQVREAILRAAGDLAVELGIRVLTIQAVAIRAGVTKGGLMHHFPDKDRLLAALRAEALSGFEAALTQHLTAPEGTPGRFSRAYVETCLSSQLDGTHQLVTALWADPALRSDWYQWLSAQETAHAATDGDLRYKLARLAADGAWLAMTDGADCTAWRDALLAQL